MLGPSNVIFYAKWVKFFIVVNYPADLVFALGNVLRRQFGEIWTDTSEPLLRGLRSRRGLLKGRCGRCRYLDLCNGNLRVRAEAVYGDVWAEDPACYLSDEEIGLVS